VVRKDQKGENRSVPVRTGPFGPVPSLMPGAVALSAISSVTLFSEHQSNLVSRTTALPLFSAFTVFTYSIIL
jgi:hypothetical protein